MKHPAAPARSIWELKAASAAFSAAGTLSFLLFLFAVPAFTGGSAGMIARLIASVLLGESVLPPPSHFDAGILAAALAVHFAIALADTLLITFVIHRWGLVTGMVLGGILGLCLYGIHFFALTVFVPWLFALHHPAVLAVHVLFGMTAGGVYELLDVDVPKEAA